MFEVTALIPLASNEGESFSEAHHAAFEAVVLDHFGGLSRLPGTVDGKWLDAGRTHHDRLVAHVIAVPSIVDGAKLGEVVAFAKVHHRQEAVFVRFLGIAEVL